MGNAANPSVQLEDDEKNINGEVLIQGYLKKESTYLKKLKMRWVVLKGNHLYSYDRQSDYDSNNEPTKCYDLKLFNDVVKHNKIAQFELISSDPQLIPNKAFIAKSVDDIKRWMDVINPLMISPTAPIHIVFERISKNVGINNDNSFNKFTTKLSQLWYYRAIDLLNIDSELVNQLKMPIILQNQVAEYIKIWRKYKLFILFKEAKPKQNNITHILNTLQSENKSESTSRDLQVLKQTFEELWLLNINKIKLYFSKSDWDDINVPPYLKRIVLNKIQHQFSAQKEGEIDHAMHDSDHDMLYPDIEELKRDLQNITDSGRAKAYDDEKTNIDAAAEYDIDPAFTLQKVCNLLSHSLFIDEQNVKKYFQPFIDYKYGRMYHLSLISDQLYNELMYDAPNCLKAELFNFILKCKQKMNGKTLPFYKYKKISNNKYKCKETEIDCAMTTDQIFRYLECDLNLKKDELKSADCAVLMNNFYSNLWDWFFIPTSIWKSLTYYNKYEIIRIRIHNIMSECSIKYNIHKRMPMLPPIWLQKYNKDLLIEQLLFGGNDNEFSFDGLLWNDHIINKVKLLNQYMLENYVAKLQFVPKQHAQNNDAWTKYMNDHKIPKHIRFKINFYSIRGHIQTDDDWLNDYIQSNYPRFAPQFKQHVLLPMFFVDNITDISATISFYSQPDFDCDINIADEEGKESKWNEFILSNNESTYLCSDLKRNTTYKVRAKYKNHTTLTQVVSFKTNLPEPPVFVVEHITDSSMTLCFVSTSPLQCDVEIIDEQQMNAAWQRVATFKNRTNYLCDDLKGNKSYRIRARYKDAFVSSNYSETASFHTLPAKPTFSIQNILPTSAEFILSNMSSLMCCVEMAEEKRSDWKQITAFSKKRNYVCQNLKSNRSYNIRAKHKGESVESDYSKQVSFTTLPNAPLCSIQNVTDTSATLKLLDSVRLDCQVQIIDKSKLQSKWTSCDYWGSFSNETTYLSTNLKNNNPFQIRARYKNKSGYSKYSKIVAFHTLPKPPVCSVEHITETTATITFLKRCHLQCYIEMYDDIASMWKQLAIIANQTSYQIENLQPNQLCKIRAKRKNEISFSDYSDVIVFKTVPEAPAFYIENAADTSALLIFPIQSDINCCIEIADDDNQESKWNEFATFSNQQMYLCNNLKYNTSYKIRAKYKNDSGCSAFSQILSFKTTLPEPPIFGIENITSKSATLRFSETFIKELQCSVQLSIDDEKKTNWNELATFSKKTTYLCSNLQRNKSYKIRVRYTEFDRFSDVLSFKTIAGWSDILSHSECRKLQELVNNKTNNKYKKQWKFLYRGSAYGFRSELFYECCRMKKNTICIIQCSKTNNVFGAFTAAPWDKSSATQSDSNAFMYLIRSNSLQLPPTIFPVRNAWQSCIRQENERFLMFGDSESDAPNAMIQLVDDCDVNEESYAYIDEKGDDSYGVPPGYQLTDDGYFKVEEVEVFQLYEKIRRHGGGNRLKWKNTKVEHWDNDDIIHWITHMANISDDDYYRIIGEVKECGCIGEDIVVLECGQDFGEAFGIENNDALCAELCAGIKELIINCGWQMTPIEEWSNEDIINWVNSMDVEEQYSNILLCELRDSGCVGEDIVLLESSEEIGEAFGIMDNEMLCDALFATIESIKLAQNENDEY